MMREEGCDETVRAVVQKVSQPQVTVSGEVVGKIGLGFVVLLGVAKEDGPETADYLVEKVAGLRVFEDPKGEMNRSLLDARGAAFG